MIIKDSSKSTIDTELESKNFTITASAKAFNLLSNLLYSNKIKAIIRELSCNAYDSHVAAGKGDVPFQVTLPSARYPFWQIQDFGVGLSEDDVYSVYINYFKSTKTKTNDQVGCFGLGSKTPFSYTKNFFITSVYNGIKTSFFIFINDNDFPSISRTNQEETDECNGLSIKIPVQEKDFESFSNYSKEIYSYFKVKPIINGIPYLHNFYDKIFTFEAGEYKLHVYKNNVENNYCRYNVIQGNICYPISDNNTKYIDPITDIVQWRTYVIIEVPIGTFEVTASREQLQFNKATNQKLEEISKILKKAVEDKVNLVLNTANNYNERCLMHSLIYTVEPNTADFISNESIITEINIKNELNETITIKKDRYGHIRNVYNEGNVYIIQNISLSDIAREKLAKYVIEHKKDVKVFFLLTINSQTQYDQFIEFWNKNGNFPFIFLSDIVGIQTENKFYTPKTKTKVATVTEKNILLMNYVTGRLKTVDLKKQNFFIPSRMRYTDAIRAFINFINKDNQYGIYYEPYSSKISRKQLKKYGVINLMNMKNLKILNDFYKYTQQNNMISEKYHYRDNNYEYYQEIIKNFHLIDNKNDIKKIKFAFNYHYNNYFPTNNPMFVSYPKILNRIKTKIKEESTDVQKYLNKASLISTIRKNMPKSEAEKVCKIILNEK